MKADQGLMSVSSAAELIRQGKYLSIAGDEAALRQLPSGHWIGGTIPYFMAADGGTVSREQVFVTEVSGFAAGPVKRHGCPSHGIAMTPDEREIWISDGHNEHLHVFDVSSMPPKQVASIQLREQPGWITFSIDGLTCWPSTGEVIDSASRQITHRLSDEEGRMVMSEKLLEVHFRGSRVEAVGDQFGRGAVLN